MRLFLAACFAALVDANVLQYDTLPVNTNGAWFGSGPMQAKYACSDPNTVAGLEECLSVLLAPNGWTANYLKLVYETPSWTLEDGSKVELVRVDGSTVKVQVGEQIPMMGGMDELVDGVDGATWDGFLVATDFALPSRPNVSALQMMLSQQIVSNGFSARSVPMFTYKNDGVIDDDGCLGPVNNTPGFDATTLEEKCPGVKTFTSGMYKYTFFAYQDAAGTGCENCTLTFRNRIDVGIFTNITINSDKTLDTIGTTPVSMIRFQANMGNNTNDTMELQIELPTLVTSGRKDSQRSDPDGAAVTVRKISATSFYLDIAVAAPGPDNIAFYDPDVKGRGPPASPKSTTTSGAAGFTCVLSWLLWAFWPLFVQ